MTALKKRKFEARLTGISILEIGLAGIEGGIGDWHKTLIEVHGAVVHAHVLRRSVIVIRAHYGIGAIASALKPGRIFAAGNGGDSLNGDELVAIQRGVDDSIIAQSFLPQGRSYWRVQSLQEALSRAHKHIVERCRSSYLGQLDNVGIQTYDLA